LAEKSILLILHLRI